MSDTRRPGPGEVANEGHTVRVDVIAEPGPPPDGVRFRLESELKEDEDLVFDQDKDGMRRPDYYLVEFRLDDRTDLGLRFAPAKEDAFWVVMGSEGQTSPPLPQGPSYSDEIYAVGVDKHKLIVRNENNTVAKFTYSLGFVTGDGNSVRFT